MKPFARPGRGIPPPGGAWPYVLGFLFVALATAILFHRLYQGSDPHPAKVPPVPTPTPVPSYRVDPAGATEGLLRTLNDRLRELDLLKLLVREVETFPVTVGGKTFLAYREEFRLPRQWTAEELARELEKAAKPLKAKLGSAARFTQGFDGSVEHAYSFFFTEEWTPVEIRFSRSVRPKVCLLIDDAGYQKGEVLASLYRLRVPITVALIPGAEYTRELASEFPSRGVEVMLHMPMEGKVEAKDGDYRWSLRAGMGSRAIRKELEGALGDVPNCRGLNNHQGSEATADPELIWEVCRFLKARGLYILDSRTTSRSVVEPVARKAKMPVARRDVFLDNEGDPEAILKQLEELVGIAHRKGSAIGIGHFRPTTLKTLEGALKRLKREGVEFVYASELAE